MGDFLTEMAVGFWYACAMNTPPVKIIASGFLITTVLAVLLVGLAVVVRSLRNVRLGLALDVNKDGDGRAQIARRTQLVRRKKF